MHMRCIGLKRNCKTSIVFSNIVDVVGWMRQKKGSKAEEKWEKFGEKCVGGERVLYMIFGMISARH